GELATDYGITGWPTGEAIKAAAECFKTWRAARGAGNTEQKQVADAVLSFIERHGDSRFSDADTLADAPMVRDRAGWWRGGGDGRVYLFTADGLREAVKGFDLKAATDKLVTAGALAERGADGKASSLHRIGGLRRRLYEINPEKLGGNDGTR
ncbi:MAG: hypothetical protein KGL43_12735, partial [Burkholderiales bacterium]|nr:hypothetical protein [Burkholderiales bacterium]